MTQNPQLSVLMPVYNAEKFLKSALESVLQQSFTEFELIIIDDCSTDGGNELIQSYNDPRIRLYRNDTNRGISYSLNRGIALAATDWIVRMDSDDICYPNRLERQAQFIQEHNDGTLYSCDVRVVDEAGQPVRNDRFESPYFFYNLHFFCIIYHPAVVMRKSALEAVGGYTVPYAEDFELFWQLSRQYKMYHQAEVLLDYRQTGQSLHQVVRKREYEEAQLQQLLRNLRSVTSPDLQVPENHLHCLQHYFEPLEQENNIRSIAQCIRTLDAVSKGIARQQNPNNIPEVTLKAAAAKRKFILEHFMRSLSPVKAAALLALLGEWNYLAERVKGNVMRKK